MAEYVTKQEIEELLSQQTKILLGAMSEHKAEVRQQMSEFDKKLDRLTTTLDKFLKRLTDHEEEFILLKADVAQIKAVLKEKLGVEILIQGR